MNFPKLEFTIETETIQKAGQVESNCNEIIFINKSAPGVVIQINGYPIAPDEFTFDGGHINEINKTRYNVTSSSTSFILYIKRKIYK